MLRVFTLLLASGTLALVAAFASAPGCAHASPNTSMQGRFGFPLNDDRAGVVEAASLLGEPLLRPTFDAPTRRRLTANLDEAWERWRANPTDEMSFIWLGRRLAYLGRYNHAVAVFTAGLDVDPDSHKLLRHRGHRFITLRRFDDAIADLSRAAQLVREGDIPDAIEPDGAPNDLGIPRSTTNSNIHYHLALAQYLQGDYEAALRTHRAGERYAQRNDDQRVSSGYWVYRTLRELGREDQARAVLSAILRPEMDVIENDVYLRLLRLYARGAGGLDTVTLPEDEIGGPTFAYGVAAELIANGGERRGRAMLRDIVEGDGAWAAFGYIAAEARLAR